MIKKKTQELKNSKTQDAEWLDGFLPT